MGGTLMTSISLCFKNIFFFSNYNLAKSEWHVLLATHIIPLISALMDPTFITFRRFSYICNWGRWMNHGQTEGHSVLWWWKYLCLIVLKMRTGHCLCSMCLVAGKRALRELFSYQVDAAPARNFKAFGCGMSIWGTSCSYTWLSITVPNSWANQGTRETSWI